MEIGDDEYVCRVCGYDHDGHPVWKAGEPGHDICDCCDVQSGYGDTTLPGVRTIRARWESEGFPFHDPSCRPPDWDPREQLRNVPKQWR
ncbi:hypothetical protein ACIOHE_01985 [Streptomyces sp. NPDC087851]|uniref:hypothetical protein n=1 Tax=Streptomyces sp. NPDC087851 TaxID=3365810 RepID=UPI0037F99444